MSKLSAIDVAVEILKENGKELAFGDLWQQVVTKMELSEAQATKRIAKFYTDLSLSKHFVALENNHWDLRSRRTIDETIIDTSDMIVEEDEEELEIIEYDNNFGNDEF